MRRGALAASFLAMPAMAGDITLETPIACDLSKDCYIQQFVDRDPSESFSDFTCGTLSYDGHKGTDFAVPTLERMREGVNVLAAAAGTVTAIRDGMPDTGYTSKTAESVKNRECGNGVLIRHQDGWETQYCHLREGSVTVKNGEVVTAGQPLGLVGMSGRAQFPHLHLSLRHNDQVIDPFAPGAPTCGALQKTLWQDTPPIRPAGIISIGLGNIIPTYAEVTNGTVPRPSPKGKSLTIFANLFGPRKGDVLQLSLQGPNNIAIREDITITKDQATAFRAVGRKRRLLGTWPEGNYNGTATLIRDGKKLDFREITATID